MKLPRFYPIVDSASWVERLVGLGVKLVQLRIKDCSEPQVREQVRAARASCEQAGAQLVVNDFWQLALEERCDFVHLGQGDLDTADVGAIRRAGIKLGISTHDHGELERALRLEPAYVALGPIYPTTLKQMPWHPQGLERITEWRQRVGGRPLVAIGGLTVERARGVYAAGADVAAVVTDVVRSADPQARTREWLDVSASRADDAISALRA